MAEKDFLSSPEIKYIHFIGIGGISMSGLAEILLNIGYVISGSDIKASTITDKLERLGATIYPFHSEENISATDLVVYTAAVKEDNTELKKAKELGIPSIERATLLGQVMKKYPYSMAISGTHGKTTTTSMITMIMMESGFNPTVHIGGVLEAIGGNTKIGGNKYFISEACEYVESFLKFYPYLAVILNIEYDHVDYFKSFDHVKSAFAKFASQVPDEGYVVANIDDTNIVSLINNISCNKITYGINNDLAMWSTKDITFDDNGFASFKLIMNKQELTDINLSVPGIHNVSNALGAIASCHTLGASIESIKQGLKAFTGTHRRFELKGESLGVTVIDDYAHHPSEVKATLKAAKNCTHKKIWCVFQPHTYTRTKFLLNEFAESFYDASTVILSDIYAAREKDTGEIHSSMLADKMKSEGIEALYLEGFDNIVTYLKENAGSGDLILTMGAGDIYKVGEMYLK